MKNIISMLCLTLSLCPPIWAQKNSLEEIKSQAFPSVLGVDDARKNGAPSVGGPSAKEAFDASLDGGGSASSTRWYKASVDKLWNRGLKPPTLEQSVGNWMLVAWIKEGEQFGPKDFSGTEPSGKGILKISSLLADDLNAGITFYELTDELIEQEEASLLERAGVFSTGSGSVSKSYECLSLNNDVMLCKMKYSKEKLVVNVRLALKRVPKDQLSRPGAKTPSLGSLIQKEEKDWPNKPGIQWVSVKGGEFMMGSMGSDELLSAQPVHKVTVNNFEMSRTLVTVEEYAKCVNQGACAEPNKDSTDCNWKKSDRDRSKDPVNCVDWEQANQYAKFVGARLPSEAEFEYAARSGGKNQKYPWGNGEPTKDKAVYKKNDGTMPVCSKPAGNARVSGGQLCDMAGNLWEWMQDTWHDTYEGAPVDERAWVGGSSQVDSSYRVIRGGSWYVDVRPLRAAFRSYDDPASRSSDGGFRLAR